jgi:hypothetical protein
LLCLGIEENKMSTFEGAVLEQTVAVAKAHKAEPAAVLAVVQTESAGKSLEIDGKTPCLLFERHIFYRMLKKAGKTVQLNNAVAMGLAHPNWEPKTQYKDQGTSQGRLNLFAKARAVDDECACLSASWGVGQTMGFNGVEIGFKTGRAMLDYMIAGGVPAQVDCMMREIENKKLVAKLNAHDWGGFAYVYNGPGNAQNNYPAKMSSAYAKWKATVLPDVPLTPKPVEVPTEVPKPVTPAKPVVPPVVKGGGAVVVGGGAAALWLKHLPWDQIAFAALLVGLAIATAIILWRRSKSAAVPQLGTLAQVDTGG